MEVSDNTQYSEQEYWDQRYETEDHFEWFHGYDKFRDMVHAHVQPSDRILMVGCGNSSLSEDMYHDGFKNIVNMDYSPVVIAKMAEKCKHMPEMTWVTMNMMEMTFEDASFDVVIEKGTLDAILVCRKDLWRPEPDIRAMIDQSLCEISRILRPATGRFISITFDQPHFRKPFLCAPKYNWSVDMHTFGEFFHFFFYVLKRGGVCDDLSANFDRRLEANPRLDDTDDDRCLNDVGDGLFD